MEQKVLRIDLGGVNSYLIKKDDKFILVDTGGHMTVDKEFDNRRNKLVSELEKYGCEPGKLKLLILTHGDNDHTANAAFIRDRYAVKVAMHKADLESVENPNIDNAMESFHYKSIIYKIIFILMKKMIKKITLKALGDFEKFTPDIYIDEGDTLNEYGFEAEVLHIPGHTDGSIGILLSSGELIAGDTFANMKKPEPALNAKNFGQLYSSIDRIKHMEITTIYPGHGNPFEM